MNHLKLHHEHQATVYRVPDGDGIEVFIDRSLLRIRLRHVDAPESGQPYAREATLFLRRLCLNKLVTFRIHKWDNYSRAIADVELKDGPDLGMALTQAGLAWWYRRYSRAAVFAEAQKHAQQKRNGLWKDPNPTPPWEYRRRKVKR